MQLGRQYPTTACGIVTTTDSNSLYNIVRRQYPTTACGIVTA